VKIIFSAKTDTGRVRKENQDSYGIFGQKNIFFVCDGMGGGAAGDFASRCAVDVNARDRHDAMRVPTKGVHQRRRLTTRAQDEIDHDVSAQRRQFAGEFGTVRIFTEI